MVSKDMIGSGIKGIGGLIASRTAANAQNRAAGEYRDAGSRAAMESRFRPIGVTNAFGSSNFQFDPNTGKMTGAGYELNPQLAALRNQFMGMAGNNNMAEAQQAFQQGQQGLFGNIANAGNIQGQTQDLYNQRQALMAPGREQQLSDLRNQVFQSGRSGLSVGGTNAGGYAAANPEMQAFYNAQRQQDNQMMAGAEQDARNYRANDMQTLQGLFGMQQQSVQPTMNYMQGAQGLEGMGLNAYNMSMQLGQANQNPDTAKYLYGSDQAAIQSRLGAVGSNVAGIRGLFDSAGDAVKSWK
jgi:hypothetical protein